MREGRCSQVTSSYYGRRKTRGLCEHVIIHTVCPGDGNGDRPWRRPGRGPEEGGSKKECYNNTIHNIEAVADEKGS